MPLPENLSMDREKNLAFVLKYCFSILAGLGCCCLVFSYLSSDYPTFITGVMQGLRKFDEVDHAVRNEDWMHLFFAVKLLLVIALFVVLGFLCDACFRADGRPARLLNSIVLAAISILRANRTFWRQLSPMIRRGLLLGGLLQFVFYLFFLFRIPLHYDEAFTYDYFSGVSFVATAFYYPLANNHIFYNLIARLFCFLPFSAETASRLPSFIASFVCSWYFFKLACRHFRPSLSLLLTILFAGSLPVVLSGIEARGYGFLTTCTVMLLYSADNFVSGSAERKHRVQYVLATVVGLYTVPAFFICVFPLSIAILFYLLVARRNPLPRRFLAGLEVSAIAILVLYTPIVFINGPSALFRQSAADRRPLGELFQQVMPFLQLLWRFLAGTSIFPLSAVLVLIAAVLIVGGTDRRRGRLMPFMVVAMLISPALLYPFFPIVTDSRTWSFLTVPLALSLGYLLTALWRITGRIAVSRLEFRRSAMVLGCFLALEVILFVNFSVEHVRRFTIDYAIRDDFGGLGQDLGRVRTVGITGGPWEYYVAEDLRFRCLEQSPYHRVAVHSQFRTGLEDVLIVAPDSAARLNRAGYELVGEHPPFYSIYLHLLPDTTAVR